MKLNTSQKIFSNDILNSKAMGLYNKQQKFSPSNLISIYHNHYFSTMTDALLVTYPKIEKFVGKEYFSFLSKKYINNYPHKECDLLNFGNKFHELISSEKSCDPFPFLPDLAKLEWILEEVYNAKDFPVLDVSNIKNTDDIASLANMKAQTNVSVRVLISKHPIFDIWSYDGTKNLDTNEQSQCVFIRKKSDDIIIENTNKNLAFFYQKLESGQTIKDSNIDFENDFSLQKSLKILIKKNSILKFYHNKKEINENIN